jgi:phage shock protein E
MIRNTVYILLILALSTSVGFAQTKKATAPKEQIERAKDTVFYVDVRTPAEFAQGSVKNAINIPVDQIENQLGQFKGKKKIVVFCKSGARSGKAKSILEQNGFSNVINGGTWQEVNASLKK